MVSIKIPTKSTYFSSNAITHLQMADEILEFAMKVGRIIGVGFLDKDYKFNKKIGFFMLLAILTFIINVIDTYLFREDSVRCIFCLLTISAQVQAFIKIYTFLWMLQSILNLRKQTENFHEHYSSIKLSQIFEEKFMVVAHFSAGLTITYINTFILIAIYPVIYFWIFNERILHFGLELPFIDWKCSWVGYGLNFVHQVVLVFAFFCASITCFCIITCFMTSGICQFDVLNILLEELNQLALANEDGSKNSEIHSKIKFLVSTHVNLCEFLQQLKETFSTYFLIEFIALVFQKTVELFSIINFNFIPGYLCIVATGFQLFLPCALGSLLVSKGDKFYDDLCGISWRLMSISDQKLIKFMIMYSKKSNGLEAGIKTLDLAAFLEIYKAVYSYLMVLEKVK